MVPKFLAYFDSFIHFLSIGKVLFRDGSANYSKVCQLEFLISTKDFQLVLNILKKNCQLEQNILRKGLPTRVFDFKERLPTRAQDFGQ